MDRTCRNINEVTFFNRNIAQKILKGIALDGSPKLTCGIDAVESVHKLGIRSRIKHVPALSLSTALLVQLGLFVIRMHLDAELVVCLNHFYKKRIVAVNEIFKFMLAAVRIRRSDPELVAPYLI